MFGFSTVKLVAFAIAAAAILSFVLLAFHWKAQAADRRDQLNTICAATRGASDNPKLDCKQVPQQITFMGKAIADLKAGIAHQNAAVTALNVESDRQKVEATKAVQKAQGRAQAAQATSERLAASSRWAVAKPCDVSKALEGAWK